MIKYKNLWLYGFWRRLESENEYIIYGINKNVLRYGILMQTFLLALFLILLFTFPGIWYLFIVLVISTSFFINKIQKNMFWFNYNSSSRKMILLSSGFRTPDAIKGRFTMGKRRFMAESGCYEHAE